jgi:GT2 family glycosyltransferase
LVEPQDAKTAKADKHFKQVGQAFVNRIAARIELMAILVSVIIPTFNRREDLCRCIASVLSQTSVSIEIIVVDDCSEDNTEDALRLNYSEVHFISCAHRYGPSHLRNLGLREAKGNFILFLDSDVVLPRQDIVQRMVETLSRDRNIGEIGGEIPVYRNILDEAIGKRLDFFGKNHDVLSKKDEKVENRLKKCTYLATCNCMVKKEVAFEVGGFDPYYKFGGEDADFGYAILKRGYTNRVDFSVGVHHQRSTTGRYLDETYRYHLTRIRFNLKHLSLMRNLIIFIMDFFSFLMFYVFLLPKILVKKFSNEALVSENYVGGWYLMKAYRVNLAKYVQIKRLRGINFLRDEEMERFEAYVVSEAKKLAK